MSASAPGRVRFLRTTGTASDPLIPSGAVLPVADDLAPVAGDYAVVAENGVRPRLVVLRGASPAALLGVVAEVLLVR